MLHEAAACVAIARLVVASMVGNRIAAFDDAGGSVLQIAGFDAELPDVVATFAGLGAGGMDKD